MDLNILLRNYPGHTISHLLILYILFISSSGKTFAQVNLVPNPGFEDLSDCDLEYGEADKAPPWKIMNDPIATPDLFHYCSTNEFFIPSLTGIEPKSGEGMVGLVNLAVEERIYARLLGDLPGDTDIYVAYSIVPREKGNSPQNILCYTNTQSLVFSDIAFQSQEIVLKSDTIYNNPEDWHLIQTCYQANGSEKLVLLGNFRIETETLRDCDYIEPMFNYAYFMVDDVIVSPFDVVPDTIVLCRDEVVELDASFYDVPIHWSDGVQGPVRTIEEAGIYTALGDVDNCFLRDKTVVIKITDQKETIEVDLCEKGDVILESPVPAVWFNGDTSTTVQVSRSGVYTASLISPCGEQVWEYIVEEKDCSIQHFVPNAFSPNNDGINDQLEFFFKSEDGFLGEICIFDRWGKLMFTARDVSASTLIAWDGTFRGIPLNPAVFVWTFEYISEKDGQVRVVAGDVVLVR